MSSRKKIGWAVLAASAFLALAVSRVLFSQQANLLEIAPAPVDAILAPPRGLVDPAQANPVRRPSRTNLPADPAYRPAADPFVRAPTPQPGSTVPDRRVVREVQTTADLRLNVAHPPGAYISAEAEYRPVDPEMAELAQADAEKGKEALELVKQYKAAAGEEPQAEVRKKLEALVNEHFDIRQQRRELEISRLETRLEKIRASLEKRSEARQLIVDRHISQLLGEGDDLAF